MDWAKDIIDREKSVPKLINLWTQIILWFFQIGAF
jgi:hypothetical protein